MIDINKELFKRTAPKKKLHIINMLSSSELRRISEDTIKRIIREVGNGRYRSRSKSLGIFGTDDESVGNNWNSDVNSINLEKGRLLFDVYIQYSNTDTDTIVRYSDLMRRGGFKGHITRDDHYGNPQTYYFSYDEEDQEKIIKAILVTYIRRKYKDKLKNQLT